MTRSRIWQLVLSLCVLVGVFGLLSSRIGAQAPATASPPPSGYPMKIPVAPGPHLNLFPHLMTKAEVLAALAQVQDSHDLVVKNNFAITLRAASNTTKQPWKLHTEADELWFVYRGSANVSLAPFSLQLGVTPPGTTYEVGEGDIVNVPRGLAYQITPTAGQFEYVALRKFAIQLPNPGRAGGPAAPQTPLSPVTTKAQIDQAYAAGNAGTAGIQPGINRIIFDRAKGPDWHQGGAPGPWENHERDEHVDFVVYGTARATIDGFITGASWDNRGVMGKGVVGGTESEVGVGDIVLVFRNTAHFFDPISSKFGYLLVNMPQSEPYWPKSIVPNGTGAY
jgi:mannose-6-phosphate isomerase-like protein (cupin superfamily)